MQAKYLLIGIAGCAVILATAVTEAKRDSSEAETSPVANDDDLATTVTNHANSINTLTTQVNEVVSKFQTMDGDIGKNEKKNMDQDKILKDMQLRLQTVEDKISLLTQQMSELRAEGMLKPAATGRFDEFQKYSRAVEYINAKNYAKAVLELKAFQGEHKNSLYASYAQYWIGEAHYLQQDYEMAISEYQKMLAKDSKSPKAPAALYKQGLSFYYLQSFDDAKAFFAKVIRTYPQSIEAVQASSQLVHINNILELRDQEAIEHESIEGNM